MGVLYLVATPIGNLEDITLRALRTLRDVAVIATEDTRHSGRLLKHFGIETPMLSYHEHSPPSRLDEILSALEAGDVAVISDAGTPGVSDPGHDLVTRAIARGYTVSPIPGPSAVMAAVPVSGLVPDGFLFLGFLPRRSRERRDLLEPLRDLAYPLVIYEAPHRLRATLDDLQRTLGDREITVARELTKRHEEVRQSRLTDAIERFSNEQPRGEFVLVVAAAERQESPATLEDADVSALLRERLASGDSPSAAAREVAKRTGLRRSDLYALTLTVKEESRADSAGRSKHHADGDGKAAH